MSLLYRVIACTKEDRRKVFECLSPCACIAHGPPCAAAHASGKRRNDQSEGARRCVAVAPSGEKVVSGARTFFTPSTMTTANASQMTHTPESLFSSALMLTCAHAHRDRGNKVQWFSSDHVQIHCYVCE